MDEEMQKLTFLEEVKIREMKENMCLYRTGGLDHENTHWPINSRINYRGKHRMGSFELASLDALHEEILRSARDISLVIKLVEEEIKRQ